MAKSLSSKKSSSRKSSSSKSSSSKSSSRKSSSSKSSSSKSLSKNMLVSASTIDYETYKNINQMTEEYFIPNDTLHKSYKNNSFENLTDLTNKKLSNKKNQTVRENYTIKSTFLAEKIKKFMN